MYLTPNFVKCRMYKSVGIMILLIISVCFANAQSKQIDNPTPFTSNEISGLINSDTKGNIYYYSFWANPGEISITLTVDEGKPVNVNDIYPTSVFFKVFDQDAKVVANKYILIYPGQGSKQVVERVKITKSQLVRFGIDIPSRNPTDQSVVGQYRVRIGGSVDISKNSSTSEKTDGRSAILDRIFCGKGLTLIKGIKEDTCLPIKGTLLIKMKDGSKKVIDLSQVEEIEYVEP